MNVEKRSLSEFFKILTDFKETVLSLWQFKEKSKSRTIFSFAGRHFNITWSRLDTPGTCCLWGNGYKASADGHLKN